VAGRDLGTKCRKTLAVIPLICLLILGLSTGDTYSLWSQSYDIEQIEVGRGVVGLGVSGAHQEIAEDAAHSADDLAYVSADEALHTAAAGGDKVLPGTGDIETCFSFTVKARADGNIGMDYEISLADGFLDNDDPIFAGASIKVSRDYDHDQVGDGPWYPLSAGTPGTGMQSAVPATKAEATADHDWVACVTTNPEEEEYQNNAWVTVHTDSGEVLRASDSWNAKFRATSGPRLDLLQVSHQVFHS
jgi:hypothetical protein